MTTIPFVTLNNGVRMPQLGLGVWQVSGPDVVGAIHAALNAGYRLIDTAAAYGNEESVGEAIRTSGKQREEIFVTTKLWNSDQGYDNTLRAFEASLKRLGLNYVDLYLIHWPVPKLDKYVETWEALEDIYASGRAKAIGVSNFNIEHLDNLLLRAKVVPAVNQVELHPRLQQRELREYCTDKQIQIESWSPIGGNGDKLGVLNDDTIVDIADKHHKTPAQIILRWHIQNGLVAIPKSVHADRIRENAAIFDFELDNDDIAKISALNVSERRGPDPVTMDFR